MKIGIVIPWREEPSRVKPFNIVKNWYLNNFPDSKIYLVDSRDKLWNASASRNIGVKLAEEDNCDIIIMSDADTLPQIHSLQNAINSAQLDNYIHNPYNEYRLLEYTANQKIYDNPNIDFRTLESFVVDRSCAGVWVFRPSSWWAIGGSDENFSGWGYEDTAQNYAHFVIHGFGFKKHPGIVFAMNHTPQENRDLIRTPNHERFVAYQQCENAEQILKLIKSNH